MLTGKNGKNRQLKSSRKATGQAVPSGRWLFLLTVILLQLGSILPEPVVATTWYELEAIPDSLAVTQLEWHAPVTITTVSDSSTVRAVSRQLLEQLSRQGWWEARFDSLVQSGDNIVIHLTPGSRYQLAAMQYSSSSSQPSYMLDLTEPATETIIRERLQDELATLEASGAAFAEIQLEQVQVENGDVSLEWEVKQTTPVRLSRQLVQGNLLTQAGVVGQLTRFKPGMVYTPLHWEKARRNLQRQIFVTRVEPIRLVRSSADEYACLISMTEAPSYFFAGNLGYSRGERVDGYWVWSADIRLLNILGSARELYLQTTRTAPRTRSISVRYREPFLFGSQLFLEPHLMQQDHDSTYHERNYGFTAGWRPSFTLALTSGVSRQEVFPDSLHGWVEQGILQERNTVWQTELLYDSRDDMLHPRSGLRGRYSFIEKRKQVHPPGAQTSESRRVIRQEVSAQQPVRLLRYWTLLVELEAQLLQSNSTLALPDLLRVGGSRSLRGYREEQFLVDRFLLGRLELQRHLGRGSDLHLFLDGALMKRQDVFYRQIGYGAGLKLRIRQGYLGVDYALPGGGSPGEGKLHLLYESVF